jgi:hypothetical protein
LNDDNSCNNSTNSWRKFTHPMIYLSRYFLKLNNINNN